MGSPAYGQIGYAMKDLSHLNFGRKSRFEGSKTKKFVKLVSFCKCGLLKGVAYSLVVVNKKKAGKISGRLRAIVTPSNQPKLLNKNPNFGYPPQ